MPKPILFSLSVGLYIGEMSPGFDFGDLSPGLDFGDLSFGDLSFGDLFWAVWSICLIMGLAELTVKEEVRMSLLEKVISRGSG